MKLLLGGILVLAALGLVVGGVWNPDLLYKCPYADITPALQVFRSINYVPLEHIQEVVGNSNAIGYTTQTYDIFIANSITEEAQARVLTHELCHVYEMAVLDIPVEISAQHKGWR